MKYGDRIEWHLLKGSALYNGGCMNKFSVKLLFQFRIDTKKDKAKMRTCEERIVIFEVTNKETLIDNAIQRGKNSEFDFLNDDDDVVYFEFIGIVDICHLGVEVENDEVWYDIKTLLTPMERKSNLIATKEKLKNRIKGSVAMALS